MKKRELPVMMRKNVKSNFLLILAGSFLVLLAAFLFLIPLERTESNIDIMSVVMILSGFLFILSFSKNKRGYFRPGWILSQGFFQMLIGCLMLFTAVFQT